MQLPTTKAMYAALRVCQVQKKKEAREDTQMGQKTKYAKVPDPRGHADGYAVHSLYVNEKIVEMLSTLPNLLCGVCIWPLCKYLIMA